MLQFTKAQKFGAKLRLALIGTSGSGKTYSALAIASGLGDKIAFIDTEHGSARKYADVFDFSVIEFDSYAVENFIDGIKSAEAAGFDVLIIDSLSHAWVGKDGILEFVDAEKAKGRSGNAFTDGWRKATPLHARLVDTILSSKLHVITCMRSKTEYVMQEDARTGKKAPVKIGMQPVQREGMEYEFDVIGDMDMEHNLIVGKTRFAAIDGKIFPKPGKELSQLLNAWLGGEAAPVQPSKPADAQMPHVQMPVPRPEMPQPAPIPPELSEIHDRIAARLKMMHDNGLAGYDDYDVMRSDILAALGVKNIRDCTDAMLLESFLLSLEKSCSSDTPFSPVDVPETQAPVIPAQTETTTPEPTLDELRETIDHEITARSMTEAEADYFARSAMESGTVSFLQNILKAVQGHPLKAKTAPAEVKPLQAHVKELIKTLVLNGIDGFEVSKRMTNSVNEWLGVKKVDDCTDIPRLSSYIEHLRSKITEEVVA